MTERTWKNPLGETIRVVREKDEIAVYHDDIPNERLVWQNPPGLLRFSDGGVAVISNDEISFVAGAAAELRALAMIVTVQLPYKKL